MNPEALAGSVPPKDDRGGLDAVRGEGWDASRGGATSLGESWMFAPTSPSMFDGSRVVTRCTACASVSHREAANARAEDYDVEGERGATSTVE